MGWWVFRGWAGFMLLRNWLVTCSSILGCIDAVRREEREERKRLAFWAPNHLLCLRSDLYYTTVTQPKQPTPSQPIHPTHPAPPQPSAPFETSHFVAWGTIAIASLAATIFGAPDLAARMALPFGLAATVGGFLIGNLVPGKLHGVLHPVVVTAVISNAGAALYGAVRGLDYSLSQKIYLAKVGAWVWVGLGGWGVALWVRGWGKTAGGMWCYVCVVGGWPSSATINLHLLTPPPKPNQSNPLQSTPNQSNPPRTRAPAPWAPATSSCRSSASSSSPSASASTRSATRCGATSPRSSARRC